MKCRVCRSNNLSLVCNLGMQPPSNKLVTVDRLPEAEKYYPLILDWCPRCSLFQVNTTVPHSELFDKDYPYYSSESPSNVSHAKEFIGMLIERFSPKSILEVGCNDGYLLQHVPGTINRMGLECATGPAEKAREKGIPVIAESFCPQIASYLRNNGMLYDIICGVNVFAHQPDLTEFMEAVKIALAPTGVMVMEFPYGMNLITECQFDTIYHEHYSYPTLTPLMYLFNHSGFRMFDVEFVPEHGGSIRIFVGHAISTHESSHRLTSAIIKEHDTLTVPMLSKYSSRIIDMKANTMNFLFRARADEKKVFAYGAAAKAATFFNTFGIRQDLVSYIIDRSPEKMGKYMPGSRIYIAAEPMIKMHKPDYILITAWNLKDEIIEQLSYIREWNGMFVTTNPMVHIL